MNIRGKFIVLEGGDGVGKTSCVAYLKDRLKDEYAHIHYTHAPGATALGRKLREMLKSTEGGHFAARTQLYLFAADRTEHLREIARTLEQGIHVISDRLDPSGYAYQIAGKCAPELEAHFWEIHNEIFSETAFPDAYIYYTTTLETALRRTKARGETLDHFEEEEFQRRVLGGYEEFFRKTEIPHYPISAEQNLSSQQLQTLLQVREILER